MLKRKSKDTSPAYYIALPQCKKLADRYSHDAVIAPYIRAVNIGKPFYT